MNYIRVFESSDRMRCPETNKIKTEQFENLMLQSLTVAKLLTQFMSDLVKVKYQGFGSVLTGSYL